MKRNQVKISRGKHGERGMLFPVGTVMQPTLPLYIQNPYFQIPEADSMTASNVVTETVFLSQTADGVMGNFSPFYHYLFLFFSKKG